MVVQNLKDASINNTLVTVNVFKIILPIFCFEVVFKISLIVLVESMLVTVNAFHQVDFPFKFCLHVDETSFQFPENFQLLFVKQMFVLLETVGFILDVVKENEHQFQPIKLFN